jgi:hypothetical protein
MRFPNDEAEHGIIWSRPGQGTARDENRAYKYARVLENLHQAEVVSDEVPQRLTDGGGIDAI